MKIGVIYTGLPPALLADINSEIARVLPDAVIMTFSDPSILSEIIAAGKVTAGAESRLVGLYLAAKAAGADIIYNICSSVGDVADDAAPLFRKMGVPVVRVDEKMASDAVSLGKKIGVVATLPSTLEPTKRLVRRKAEEAGKEIEIVDVLVDNSFNKSTDAMNALILKKIETISDKVDIILLAQASMNPCRLEIERNFGLRALASPISGADYLKEAVDTISVLGRGAQACE